MHPTPLDPEEKENFSMHVAKLIALYNNNFNPFREYECELAEISFGHGVYDSRKNDQVFYFDYPYSSEFGAVTDMINDAQRGILPEGAKIDRDTYKNLDIDIANIFAASKEKAYVLYKYIPTGNRTPCIAEIMSNLALEKDETLYNRLIRYFFLIYHCTESNPNLDKKNLFENVPQVTPTNNFDTPVKYLLYFNCFSKISSETEKQAITAAFIGKNDVISKRILDQKNLVHEVYEQLFPMLDIMFNNPVLSYFNKQNTANINRIEAIKNLNRTNHFLKTYLTTKIEPHIKNLKGKYPKEKSFDIMATNVRTLQSISEFINLIDKLDNTNKDDELVTLLTKTGFYSTNKLSMEEMLASLTNTIKDNWDCYEDNPPFIVKNIDPLALAPADFLCFRNCNITTRFMEIIMLTVVENVIQHGAKTNREFHIELLYNKQERSLSFKNRAIQDAKIQVSGEQLNGNFRLFNDLLRKLGIGRIELFQEPGTFEFISKLINS